MYNQNYLLIILFSCFVNTIIAIDSRVFDGQDIRFEVHKYLVQLKVHRRLSNPSLCSGSIIDHSWIITAAHCFKTDVKRVTVFRQTEDRLRKIAQVDRSDIHIHPSFVSGDASVIDKPGDIALIKTKCPIKFSASIQPVKLTKTPPQIGQSAVIAGYGASEDYVAYPREGTTKLTQCPYDVDGLICSIDTVRAGSGDSGGSLISRGRLIGVTSASCKNVHIHKNCITIYMDVFSNLDWIQKVVTSY
ncbi:snake venom serine protease rhinocerase 5-like [Galleria mellonella]|uniref:Snake venom serine protease rhinocerase 5-like n=1 Tax=Galleria mellonella TaxID=7137 RepID=A0A6J3CDS6_GALME|nr:snake venom serine protease rhinocerase 5-like [Galleria mellonella]